METQKGRTKSVCCVSDAFLSAGETASEQNKQNPLLSQSLHSSIGNAHFQRGRSPNNRVQIFLSPWWGRPCYEMHALGYFSLMTFKFFININSPRSDLTAVMQPHDCARAAV